MCQISVVNLHDNLLNKKLFLLMGSFGSIVHKDGWGMADSTNHAWKCAIPMHWSTDAGKILREKFPKTDGTLLGHIRQASPQVPVISRNSHPFFGDDVTFVHNGKLTPKVEKDFVMEEDVPDLDKHGHEQIDEKTGRVKMKSVKRSDSLIFFEKFLENWKNRVVGTDVRKEFTTVLNDTMSLFYGKFAMIFIIQENFFVVRGKTADLHISYFKESYEENAKAFGFAINTSKEVLDTCTTLLSNLEQLHGRKGMIFTYPEILPEESIFIVNDVGVEKIGEIKENSAPSYPAYNYNSAWEGGAGNFTQNHGTKDTGGTKKEESKAVKLQEEVFNFMMDYSLSPADIQNLFWIFYELPMVRVNEAVLTHFTKKVIPRLANLTNKDNKKKIRKVLSGLPVRFYRYYDSSSGYSVEYPWMMNPKNIQNSFIRRLEGKS